MAFNNAKAGTFGEFAEQLLCHSISGSWIATIMLIDRSRIVRMLKECPTITGKYSAGVLQVAGDDIGTEVHHGDHSNRSRSRCDHPVVGNRSRYRG